VFGYHADSFDEELQAGGEPRSPDKPALLPERNGAAVTPLPSMPDGRLSGLAERRRSRRVFNPQAIEVAPVAACLQSAFGITGEWPLGERHLPLTAAPSPGGINTYDALLLVRNVADLESGTYCYLPQDHALASRSGDPVPFDRLFGEQEWAAGAACAIVLVADLRRQASRYTFPTTISATLIEAGARVELLLLQAEEASLGAVVVGLNGVGAFDRGLAATAGLPSSNSMVVPICAVLLGGKVDKPEGDS
jgi:SagB-type dehydrogenase family enzyme